MIGMYIQSLFANTPTLSSIGPSMKTVPRFGYKDVSPQHHRPFRQSVSNSPRRAMHTVFYPASLFRLAQIKFRTANTTIVLRHFRILIYSPMPRYRKHSRRSHFVAMVFGNNCTTHTFNSGAALSTMSHIWGAARYCLYCPGSNI